MSHVLLVTALVFGLSLKSTSGAYRRLGFDKCSIRKTALLRTTFGSPRGGYGQATDDEFLTYIPRGLQQRYRPVPTLACEVWVCEVAKNIGTEKWPNSRSTQLHVWRAWEARVSTSGATEGES